MDEYVISNVKVDLTECRTLGFDYDCTIIYSNGDLITTEGDAAVACFDLEVDARNFYER